MTRNLVTVDWMLLCVVVVIGAWFAVDFVGSLTLEVATQIEGSLEAVR